MYSANIGAVERSTDDARNSSTRRRLRRTRSESVLMDIFASTLREQAGTSVREPSNSTTQTRHTLTGVRLSRKQIVGVSIPSFFAASSMVEPSGTDTGWPSILMSMEWRSGAGGAFGMGPRGRGIVGFGASSGGFSTKGLVMKRGSSVSGRTPGRSRRSGRDHKLMRRASLGLTHEAWQFPVQPSQAVLRSLIAEVFPAGALRLRGTEHIGRKSRAGRSWPRAAVYGEDQLYRQIA